MGRKYVFFLCNHPTCQELGEEWARADRQRRLRGGASVEEYTRINIEESKALAEVFVSEKFLRCDF